MWPFINNGQTDNDFGPTYNEIHNDWIRWHSTSTERTLQSTAMISYEMTAETEENRWTVSSTNTSTTNRSPIHTVASKRDGQHKQVVTFIHTYMHHLYCEWLFCLFSTASTHCTSAMSHVVSASYYTCTRPLVLITCVTSLDDWN